MNLTYVRIREHFNTVFLQYVLLRNIVLFLPESVSGPNNTSIVYYTVLFPQPLPCIDCSCHPLSSSSLSPAHSPSFRSGLNASGCTASARAICGETSPKRKRSTVHSS